MTAATVIVPARNAASTLPTTLAGLARQSHDSPFEVFVVDDGSTDETVELARAHPVVTDVIEQDGRGPAAARNAGAARAGGDVLAFLDADCDPTPDWLAHGLDALTRADFAQGKVVPPPGTPVGPFDRTLWVTGPWGLYESANLFVSRELFRRLGGFESWLVPADGKELGEDVWFGWRARRSGALMAFCGEALAYHAVFPRDARGYVGERTRLRYFPALVERIPELRDTFFYRRWFLNRRSATFDVALVAAAAVALGRRPAWALAALPYAIQVAGDARGHSGRGRVEVPLAAMAADAVTLAALARGSIERRTPLL